MKILFTLSVLLIACSGFTQNKINLRYNFQNGDKYSVTTNIISQSNQEIEGSPQEVSFNQNINYILSFKKDKSITNYITELKFNKLTELINQSGYKQFFSSDSSNTEISDFFKYFLSKTLNFRLSDKGHTNLLYSVDELFPDSSETKQKFIFSQSIEQKVQENLPVNIIFPEKLIQIGDKWTDSDTSVTGIFNFYNKVYSLDSISATAYFISGESDFSSNKNEQIPMNRVRIIYDVSGKTKSNYILDKKSRIIKKGNTTQTGNGFVHMKYTKNSDPAYSWKMTINNIINLSTKRLSDE